MLKIGLTGGIGSGKSTVARIFETLGIPVYYADDRAKQILADDPEVIRRVTELLGPEAYGPDGSPDRSFIAAQVFADTEKLRALEQIIHPATFADAARWQDEQANKGFPYTVKEAALLYESGSYRSLDRIIVVTAPEPVRIARVVLRDGSTEEQVRARMDKQLPEEEKAGRADFLIVNDGQHALIPQVVQLHRRLLRIALA